MKKQSIARTVTRHVSAILVVALAILFILSYIIVYNAVTEKNINYSETVVGIFADIVADNYAASNTAISVDDPQIPRKYGDYLCKWYNIEYAYVYIPDIENGKVTYVGISLDMNYADKQKIMDGDTIDYVLTDAELAVWNGEEMFGHITVNNEFGHEVTTVMRIEDGFGNRAIAGIDISYHYMYVQVFRSFSLLAAVIIAVLLGINFGVYLIIRKKVSKPAQKISGVMHGYIAGGKRSDIRLDESGSDEYSMIAASFNKMTDNISSYLDSIGELTRDQEHQKAELDIAGRIQMGFLPPSVFESDKYRINAMMTPAKDVGGDLYDYLRLDGDRVLTVIADVSGKGIAASMFMAVTLVLIRQFAKLGLSPSKILEKTNDVLSENNAAMMFATAFVGIYDAESGEYTYSNAGHNLPYLVNSTITTLNGASGALLGLFEGEAYTEKTVNLDPGDTVFLYTDGVNEATDKNDAFFGNSRLEGSLKSFGMSHKEDVVVYVYNTLTDFSKDTEQHDDITMLALTVKDKKEYLLDVNVNEMTKVKETILSLPLPRRKQLDLCLAAEELFVNICSYAFPGGVPENEKIRFTVEISDRISLRFEDGGIKFDPTESVISADEYDIDLQVGGLGKLIAFTVADSVKYEYTSGKNVITITKFPEGQD